MAKTKNNKSQASRVKKQDMLIALSVIVVLLFAIMLFVAFASYKYATKHFPARALDYYKIQEYSLENSEDVFESLANGGEGLRELMAGRENVHELLKFADWESGDYENVRSFGGGNFSKRCNDKGQIEYADMWWVPIGDEKYMIYIQSVSSRYGRDNDGVKCIAVTSYSHYSDIDGEWDWRTDDETVRIGTPFEIVEE